MLTDFRGHVLGTGYNGPESGAPHCNEKVIVPPKKPGDAAYPVYPNACTGALMPSGQGLDQCDAIHAEQNALLQCDDVFKIETCYVTYSPCVHCVKLLMGTSCFRIVFRHRYAHDEAAREKWLKKNNQVDVHSTKPHILREWIQLVNHMPLWKDNGPRA